VPLPRFYVPALAAGAATGTEIALPEDEASHLTRVLRLGAGDDIAVFDGRGAEYRARVARAARSAVTVALVERVAAAREPSVRLTLAQAVLKPDAMDNAVRDATMMGVAAIQPLITEHIAVKERALHEARVLERWRRVAIASAKQSRRAVVPEIAQPQRVADWLATAPDRLKLLLVEPSAAAGREIDLQSLKIGSGSCAIIVGPEGGWSPAECDRAIAAGCTLVTLGGLTLRADAVPLAALAILRFVFADL
jgi:16S rRNA (uracil1498-N3)-methyltransferase